MNFSNAMEFLERNGFSWAHLRDLFPFGEVSLREGNYDRLASKAVKCCKTDAERELLLNLLDAQASVFLEQVWVQNEQLDGGDPAPFFIEAHFASAWLQINSNIRSEFGLPVKDGRAAMLNLSVTESLFDRMIVPTVQNED